MSAYIVDTETTGAEKNPEVIELSLHKLQPDLRLEHVFSGRFHPKERILFSAMAVHHILPQDLEGCPASETAKQHLPADMEYMIGHNVDYDWEALGRPACKRVCTLAISRLLWPGNDGHGLSCLAYHLSTDLESTRTALRGAHGAAVDCELCYLVLLMELEHLHEGRPTSVDFEKLHAISEDARIPRYWSFGKFKGQPIEHADWGYLQWCLRQPDMDQYVKIACRRAMELQR